MRWRTSASSATSSVNYSQNSTQSYECDYGYDCKAQKECDMNDDMNVLNIHLNRCVTKSVNNASKSLWSIDLSIKDNDYSSFKIDTGAECTINFVQEDIYWDAD